MIDEHNKIDLSRRNNFLAKIALLEFNDISFRSWAVREDVVDAHLRDGWPNPLNI